MNTFTSINDSTRCTDFKHLLLNSSICRYTALSLQLLLLGALHLRHALRRIQTACHTPGGLCDLVITQALSCYSIVLSKLPPCVINLLRIIIIMVVIPSSMVSFRLESDLKKRFCTVSFASCHNMRLSYCQCFRSLFFWELCRDIKVGRKQN